MRLRMSLLTERIGVFKSLPTPVGDISDVKATVSSDGKKYRYQQVRVNTSSVVLNRKRRILTRMKRH